MASTVEIIIKAVDKYSKEFQKINVDFRAMARSAAAVAGGVVLAYHALEAFGKIARELNFKKTADQIDYMSRSLKDVEAALLKFNVGGMQIQGWLGQAAQGFGDLIRLIGVGLAGALYAANIGTINMHRNLSKMLPDLKHFAEITLPFTDIKVGVDLTKMGLEEYTDAMMVADLTTAELTFHTNVTAMATDGYAKSLENVNKKLAATSMRNVKLKDSVTDLWEANKKLRDSLWEVNEAIRAGDPRALAAAQRGSGSGGGLRTGLSAPGARTAGSVNKGDTIVNVIVDGEIIRSQTRRTLAEDVFRPVIKGGNVSRKR